MKPKSPASLPETLTKSAFISGEDVAWEQEDCANAIQWLRENGYAILGIELWLIEGNGIRTVIRTKSGPAIYVTNCNPIKGESWDSYLGRSALDAAEKINSFRWPDDSLESQRPVYFNLCWADQDWFRIKEANAAHIADK